MTKQEARTAFIEQTFSDPKKTQFLLWKEGGWYRPDSKGYTIRMNQAGIFNAAEARSHMEGCDKVEAVSVELSGLRGYIKSEIDRLKDRIRALEAKAEEIKDE